MPTRRQHYVWRHYLEAWQALDNFVSTLMGDKVKRANPSKIMVQRDFYRVGALTTEDINLLRALLLQDRTSPVLRDLHRNLIDQFHRLATLNAIAQTATNLASELKTAARNAIIEAEERIHSEIEGRAVPILGALRNEDASVIQDDDASVHFFHFISHQYFRTKVVRDTIEEELRSFLPADTATRIRHVLCHCAATNVGATLYRDRADFELLFLRPPMPESLITGDQPIVNLLAKHDGTEPAELAFYYPLTPSLAMILSPKSLGLRSSIAAVTPTAVRELNDLVAWKSRRFLVARSDTLLQPYVRRTAAPPPSPLTILRGLPGHSISHRPT